MTYPKGTIVRNPVGARINHWITGGCFVLLMLSGLSRSEERRVGKECLE